VLCLLVAGSCFGHNVRRPTQFVCPNSDSVCPNSDKIYLTVVTFDFFYYFLLFDEKRDSFLPSGSWIVLYWLPAETLSLKRLTTPGSPIIIITMAYLSPSWIILILSVLATRTAIQHFLLPHGPAVHILPASLPNCVPVGPSNVSLRLSSGKSSKIYERKVEGRMPLLINPETIIFDNDGTMYIINEDAKLVSLHDFQPLVEEDTSILTATAIEVADLGHGRP